MTTVFIHDPKRPLSCIAEVDAEIRSAKFAWALFTVRGVPKRRLLGATAFFSYAACRRAKLGSIEAILERPNFCTRRMTMDTHSAADLALNTFHKLGGEFKVRKY